VQPATRWQAIASETVVRSWSHIRQRRASCRANDRVEYVNTLRLCRVCTSGARSRAASRCAASRA
jgi:hypothetical protein